MMRSTFVKTFGKHFNENWEAESGFKETTKKRTKYILHSGEIDFAM